MKDNSQIAKSLCISESLLLREIRAIAEFFKQQVDYAEIVIHFSKILNFDVVNCNLNGSVNFESKLGFYIRVIDYNKCYFLYQDLSSINDLYLRAPDLLKQMRKNAELQDNKTNWSKYKTIENWVKMNYSPDIQILPDEVALTTKIQEIKTISQLVKNSYDFNLDISVAYYENQINFIYSNTEHKIFESFVPSFEFYFDIGLENSMFSKQYSFIGGYEVLQQLSKRVFEELIPRTQYYVSATKLKSQLEYTYLALSYDILGLILHESFGHACEADYVINKSSGIHKWLSKKIASEAIDVLVDPQLLNCGYTPIDFEGITGKKKYLIKNGILIDYIHSRESADEFESTASGHLRTISFDSPPSVRMTSIYMESRNIIGELSPTFNLDEIKKILFEKKILTAINSVVLLDGWIGGSANWSALTFEIDLDLVFLFKATEKTRVFSGGTLSGSSLNFLKNYIAAINPVCVNTTGQCWKFDSYVLTSDGGPKISLFKKNESYKIKGI